MNKPFLIVGVIVVALLVGGAVFWSSSQAPEPVVTPAPQGQPSQNLPPQNVTPPPPPTVPVTLPSPTPSTLTSPPPATPPPPVPAPAAITPPAAPASVNVAIAGFAFSPSTLTIKAGTKVIWTNNDGAPHTATSNSGVFASPTLNQGQSFSFTFTAPGTYSYKCALHPSMQATVVVTQ